ncbi:MAG: DUF2490 domain-containing protein [Candidatus Omnitrophota bacterium]
MRKVLFAIAIFATLYVTQYASAERDWEYWSQESFFFPVNKRLSFLMLPEWRFKEDMHNVYLFKLENGLAFKINEFLEVAPYYVYQEKKSGAIWDRADLVYFDTSLKLELKNLWGIKLSNRVRYQYDFDKDKTTFRNAAKVSRSFNVGKLKISPYFSEEPFYDAKLERITEHRTAAGFSFELTKNVSFGLGYMLNSKKGTSKWTYANVLVSNLGIKF